MTAPRVLVIQHEDDCPPAWLGEWLAAAGLTLDVRRGDHGDEVPRDLDGADALIVLGGEMGAYDDEAYPWLPATRRLIAAVMPTGAPFLGVCLGQQLAAVALGGRLSASRRSRRRARVRPTISCRSCVSARRPSNGTATSCRGCPTVRSRWRRPLTAPSRRSDSASRHGVCSSTPR